MEMYHAIYFDERVALSPAELNKMKVANDLNNALVEKLKAKYEGRCTANGYVRPGTIGIMGRSFGRAANGDFTGNWLYDCKVTASVLYPTAGSEFQVDVIQVNNMGAYAHFDDSIRILLPRDTHVGNKKFDDIKKGDRVFVRLDRSRFQMNDTYIMAVGTLIDAPAPAAVPALVAAPAPAVLKEAPAAPAAEDEDEKAEEAPAAPSPSPARAPAAEEAPAAVASNAAPKSAVNIGLDRIVNPFEVILQGKKYLYNSSNQVFEIKSVEEEPENWDFEIYKGDPAPPEIQERFRRHKAAMAAAKEAKNKE